MNTRPAPRLASDAGFTLIEVMVTTLILLTVSGVVITGVLNMTQLNSTVTNRSAMFAGVRNATALLQQEVGQAGRISLPGPVKVAANAAAGETTLTVDTAEDMFIGEYLVVGTGSTQETLAISGIAGEVITFGSALENAHLVDEPVSVQGAFWAGVVPSHNADGTVYDDGSNDTVLKIFGDINGSGKMVYVEYTCDLNENVLYRNQMDFDAGAKAVPGVEEILVENVQANPDNAPCFTYQEETIANNVFVIGVAITLTVQSETVDPITKKFQQESKALLNVSPRNVFNAWQMYSLLVENRVQPTPPATLLLFPKLQE
jgi:prepilin-type N-terminal cleavage/methylation domain-containing protein